MDKNDIEQIVDAVFDRAWEYALGGGAVYYLAHGEYLVAAVLGTLLILRRLPSIVSAYYQARQPQARIVSKSAIAWTIIGLAWVVAVCFAAFGGK